MKIGGQGEYPRKMFWRCPLVFGSTVPHSPARMRLLSTPEPSLQPMDDGTHRPCAGGWPPTVSFPRVARILTGRSQIAKAKSRGRFRIRVSRAFRRGTLGGSGYYLSHGEIPQGVDILGLSIGGSRAM